MSYVRKVIILSVERLLCNCHLSFRPSVPTGLGKPSYPFRKFNSESIQVVVPHPWVSYSQTLSSFYSLSSKFSTFSFGERFYGHKGRLGLVCLQIWVALVLVVIHLVLMVFEVKAVLVLGKIHEKQLFWLTPYESWRRKEWILPLAYVRLLKASGVFLSSVLMSRDTFQIECYFSRREGIESW